VGESSFNEEGACIKESRELLAPGVGVTVGARLPAAFVGAEPRSGGVSSVRVEGDFGFGVASICAGVGFGRGLKILLSHPCFFGLTGSLGAGAAATVNLPWTIVPETRLKTLDCLRGRFDPVCITSSAAYQVSVP
jgi:hypothetical protein